MTVEFNHLFVTLDHKSVEMIGESEFIRSKFCHYERKTVEAGDDSWTGSYLMGRRSYLEFFDPGGAEGVREGLCGIGFSTQRIGEIDDVEERLRELVGNRTKRVFQIRKTEFGDVPWYHSLTIESPEGNGLWSWIMEYHPEYLAYRNIEVSDSGMVERAATLRPEHEGDGHPVLFDDVVTVDMALTAEEHDNLAPLLVAFGYESSRKGEVTNYASPGFVVHVSESSRLVYRIQTAVCSLSGDADLGKPISFGAGATLSSDKEIATWHFGLEHGSW